MMFQHFHDWARKYVKHKGVNVKSVYTLLSESEGTSKSNLVKTIYYPLSEALLCIYNQPEKPRIL